MDDAVARLRAACEGMDGGLAMVPVDDLRAALAMAELLTELSRYVDRARAALRGKEG